MIVLRKTLAVMAMILCAGVLLVCLTGVVGVWTARAPLTGAAVASLTTTYGTLRRVETAAGQLRHGLGELQSLTGKVDDAAGELEKSAGVLKQIGPIDDALNALTDGANKLDGRVAGLRASAGEIQSQAGGLATQADILRQRIPSWVSAGAVAISLTLLWICLGQVSLFFHALAWFRRPSAVTAAAQCAGTAVQPVTAGSPDQHGGSTPPGLLS